MAWFLMLFAVGCFLVVFITKSFALGILCLLLALVLLLAATVMLLSARVASATRKIDVLSAEELRVLREQAQAKRAANAQAGAVRASSGAPTNTTPESPPPASR